jgi:hypothetical protein
MPNKLLAFLTILFLPKLSPTDSALTHLFFGTHHHDVMSRVGAPEGRLLIFSLLTFSLPTC